MAERVSGAEPVTLFDEPVTQPVTAPATPVTATQYPVPNTQTPVLKIKNDKKTDTTDSQPVGEKPKTATGSRLPEDWKPNQADVDYCRTERPDLLPSKVAANFFDYWIAKPGAAGRKLDWSATWRTWVRKESADNAGRPGGARHPPISTAEQNARNNAEAMRLLGGKPRTTDFDEGMIIDA